MKLNLGCGEDFRSGWLNVDCRRLFAEGPEFWCCSLADLEHRITEESVAEIDARNVLEFLSWREVEATLVALVRKLQPGGVLSLRVPDGSATTRAFVDGELDDETAQALFYGDQAYPEDTRRCLWTLSLVERCLAMLGLNVEQLEQRDGHLLARGRRPS